MIEAETILIVTDTMASEKARSEAVKTYLAARGDDPIECYENVIADVDPESKSFSFLTENGSGAIYMLSQLYGAEFDRDYIALQKMALGRLSTSYDAINDAYETNKATGKPMTALQSMALVLKSRVDARLKLAEAVPSDG